jgi:hypothetical protein
MYHSSSVVSLSVLALILSQKGQIKPINFVFVAFYLPADCDRALDLDRALANLRSFEL